MRTQFNCIIQKETNFLFALTLAAGLLCTGCTGTQPAGDAPLRGVQLLRQPYLQNAFRDSISILWKTNTGQSCSVKFGTAMPLTKTQKGRVKLHRIGHAATADTIEVVEDDGDIETYLTFPDSTDTYLNLVTIKGLERGKKYFYEIYTNGKNLAGGKDYYFRTEPLGPFNFSFLAMGDIGNACPSSGFQDVTARQIGFLEDRPDFGIGTGDIVYKDGESEFYDKHFFRPMQAILKNIPFYPALGNHDWHKDPDLNFVKEWKLPNNEHYFSFDYGNAHFIAFDSREGDLYDFENQMTWLEKDLKNAQGKYDWIFVYLHHNGITCTYKRVYKQVVGLYPLFARYNVDLVLNGHAHTYERLHPIDANGLVIDSLRINTKEYPDIKNGFIVVTTGAGGQLKSK